MASQSDIRQAFTRDLDLLCQAEMDAWLIKGDFDHFKLKNDLYGPLIADYLLDWTLEVIETQLAVHQESWGDSSLYCSAFGDDLTIYIPPSPRVEGDISQLLWKIRAAIHVSFWRRYRVGAIPFLSDFFDNVSPVSLEKIRNDLEEIDVVFDFARRSRGFLVLLPVEIDGKYQQVLNRVMMIIQHRTGKPTPPVGLQLDWICNPDGHAHFLFNEGYIDLPSVSFAACSARMTMAGKSIPQDRTLVYEQISYACQSALKICKEQRCGVYFHQDADGFLDIPGHSAALPNLAPSSQLSWSSERYLREILYFRPLDQPVLFQFNPVYNLTSMMPGDLLQTEKYRGNSYGVGLKGINEIYGQKTADQIICQLILTFSQIILGKLAAKGISAEKIYVAQFVDRITVCCEQPDFCLTEIADLIRSLAVQFNAAPSEIKIPYLRVNVVLGENHTPGYRLFNLLTLTGLTPQSSIPDPSDPRLEIRQYRGADLQAGNFTMEYNTFASAQLLATYNRDSTSFESAKRFQNS